MNAKLKTDNAYRSEPTAPGPFFTMKALGVRHSQASYLPNSLAFKAVCSDFEYLPTTKKPDHVALLSSFNLSLEGDRTHCPSLLGILPIIPFSSIY